MTKIRLTKGVLVAEAAHLLEGYDGACREIHGHSYRLFVTVRGVPVCDGRNPRTGHGHGFRAAQNLASSAKRWCSGSTTPSSRAALPAGEAFAEALGTRFERIVCVRLPADAPLRTCSARTSPPASRRGCPKEWNFTRSDSHETATPYAEWVAEDNN